jgi:hypothetical protein
MFPCSVSSLLRSGAQCRPLSVCDALLHSSHKILLAWLADSCHLLISLFPATVAFSASARHTGTPLRLPSWSLLVLLRHGLLLP